MKLDLIIMAAHPDDAEMSCGGTIASAVAQGKKVGIIDFTKGELGTRGTPEIRAEEAATASKILKITARENLGFKDGFFKNDEEHQMKLIAAIRRYQPEVVLANAIEDRHPDHAKGAALAVDACFYSGLRMIQTFNADGSPQKEWRPKGLYHYIQDRFIKPDLVVDISVHWDLKESAIRAYKSQFYNPNSIEPESYLTSPEFLAFLKARSQEMGHMIGAKFGEGYTKTKAIGITDFFGLL